MLLLMDMVWIPDELSFPSKISLVAEGRILEAIAGIKQALNGPDGSIHEYPVVVGLRLKRGIPVLAQSGCRIRWTPDR